MSSEVPEGWSRQKLGDSLIPRPKSKLPSGESNPLGYYNFYVCSHKVLKSFHNEYSSPSILFSTGGEASVHLATERYAFSTDVWATEFEGDICNEYVFRLLEENIRTINYSGFQGSGIKHLDKSFIEKLEFSIPPLPEQKKIASILTSVDEVIENTQKQIDKLQDLKKSTMNELLTKGIGHTEFKDSELGRIPKSWEVRSLREIGTFSKGKGISKKDTLQEGLPCIRYAEIYTVYDFYIKTFKSFISPNTAKSSRKLIKNEIIFAGSGETVEDIGKSVAFTLDCEAYVGGDSVVFSPKIDLNSIFLSYQLNDNLRRQMLRKLGQGSSVIHIYSSGLQEVLVSIPPMSEQKKIVSMLVSIRETIEEKKQERKKLWFLKKSLMQDLLTGKVRVTVN